MRLLMPVIAFVVAVAAATAWYLGTQDSGSGDVMVSRPEATPVAVQEATVLVARQDIPVGKKITEEDIDRQPWPQHLVIEEFIIAGNEMQLINMVARTPFKAREPFAMSRLGNPNDPGFIAASLPKGMRAVTVAVDAISGIGGFVFPGDRVDVIITHDIGVEDDYKSSADINLASPDQDSGEREHPTTAMPLPLESSYKLPMLMEKQKYSGRPTMSVTETLVSNARVLAVGRQSSQYENAANPTNVTLEVSEMDAQRIRHAKTGELTLALRSLEDAEDTATPRPVGDSDMTMLTPPSYFPYLYQDKGYASENVELTAPDYSAGPEKDEESKGRVTIVRGTEKEIVGVRRQ